MSRVALSISVLVLISHARRAEVTAQTPPGSVTLASQSQVDSFSAHQVPGRLKISGADIENLDSLIVLESIGDSLSIVLNPLLTDLDGLASLRTVGADVWIVDNDRLENIDGLSALTSARGVKLLDNPSIKNVDGFAGLTSVEDASIYRNATRHRARGAAGLSHVRVGTIPALRAANGAIPNRA